MTTTTDEDLTGAAGLALVRRLARGFHPPRGLNHDDLESAGGMALVLALRDHDPGRGMDLRSYVVARIRQGIQNAIRDHIGRTDEAPRRRVYNAGPLTATSDDGGEYERCAAPPSDPADIAAARELMTTKGRGVVADLPPPGEVADRVNALRQAMFGAVAPADVAGVIAAVVSKAKGGNLQAAKMVIDLLAPGRSGVTVNQQAIVVHQGDIG